MLERALPSCLETAAIVGEVWGSGVHFSSISEPQVERIGPGMTIRDCREPIAAGPEDRIDLVVGGREISAPAVVT